MVCDKAKGFGHGVDLVFDLWAQSDHPHRSNYGIYDCQSDNGHDYPLPPGELG
jgi:hypothetical protein